MTRSRRRLAVAGAAGAVLLVTAVTVVVLDRTGDGAPALTNRSAPTGAATTPTAGPQPSPDPRPPSPRDARVSLTRVAAAQAPIAGVAGPDGTVWIAERAGRVRVLDQGGLSAPVLDITAETTTDGERGLLGIAFNDDFSRFYLSYTDLAGDTAIEELAVTGSGELRPQTRRTLLTQPQPFANHNGGHLGFGPDGMLYIGLGDGGAGGDPHDSGQDRSTLLGTLLRIDPAGADPYAIPPDNPFVDDPAARDEIWAYGLRNPWRFAFDAETGDLFIADVGQNSREEINRAPADSPGGENYGWARMEGTLPFSGQEPADHQPPILEYDTGQRCSVTGGHVYRGTAIPDLVGAYLFSDFCDGGLWALALRDGEVVDEVDLAVNGGAVAGFVEGPDRELYLLDLNGAVHRLDPAAG